MELYGDKIYIQTTEDGENGSAVITSTVRFTKTCLSDNRTQISITNTKSITAACGCGDTDYYIIAPLHLIDPELETDP